MENTGYINLDPFSINLDQTNNIANSTKIILSNLLNIADRLVVINFSEFDIVNFIKENTNTRVFEQITNKLNLVEKPVKSFEWITEYLLTLEQECFVFLIGIEELIPCNADIENKDLEVSIGNYITTINYKEKQDWQYVARSLDEIYGQFQSKLLGLFTNILIDRKSSVLFIEYLKDSENLSICGLSNSDDNEDYENLQRRIIDEISKCLTLEEILAYIETEKDKLGPTAFKYLRAVAFFNSGNIVHAIHELEVCYDQLNDEAKFFLVDLLIFRDSNESREWAEKILLELREKNPYIRGLYSSFLRLFVNQKEKLNFYINEALIFDPENPSVIELNASRLANSGSHIKAAQEFRRLAKLTNYDYYEMVARINEVINGNFDEYEKAIQYIIGFVEDKPKIKNDAISRLSEHFLSNKNSPFLAYKCLSYAKLYHNANDVDKVINLKFSILKDDIKAARALGKLKIQKNEKDAYVLRSERSKALIVGIRALAGINKGYLSWRDFLECQSETIWAEDIYVFIRQEIAKLITLDFEALSENSPINIYRNVEIPDYTNIETLIQEQNDSLKKAHVAILQDVFRGGSCEEKFKNFDEFQKTALTIPELFNDNMLRIISRYYVSLYAVKKGHGQMANEMALSILELCPKVPSEYKNSCILFGLVSWANSQFRAGRKLEGIYCILSAIDIAIESNEIMPIVYEGLNIVGKFILTNFDNINEDEQNFWLGLRCKVLKHNELFAKMFIFNNDQKVDSLIMEIQSTQIKDENWAGNVVNLISLYLKSGNSNCALQTIEKYGHIVIPLLSKRTDVFYHALYNWACIYMAKATEINDIFIAYKYIESSCEMLEEFRSTYAHREERAAFSSIASQIYRMHLHIDGVLLDILTEQSPMFYTIQMRAFEILSNLTPKTLLEQKDYYASIAMSSEAVAIKKDLDFHIVEYNSMFSKNSRNLEFLSAKAEIIQTLSEKLKIMHPHYKALADLEPISIKQIQEYLGEDELFFQYANTASGVFHAIITKDEIMMQTSSTSENLEEVAKTFSLLMQTLNANETKELDSCISTLSNAIAKDLLNILTTRKFKAIFCIPDLKFQMFPLSAVKINGIALIDYIDRIVNLIDYGCLLKIKTSSDITGVVNQIIGNENDSQLKKIEGWINLFDSDKWIKLLDGKEPLVKSIRKNSDMVHNTLCLYGHGVYDPSSQLSIGAKGFEGRDSIILLKDLITSALAYQNLILISCRTGSPDYNNADEFSGVWSTIFEQFSGNIIFCKWDVFTDHTINILNDIFSNCFRNGTTLAEALIIAQRSKRNITPSPQVWAGLEFWIN